VFIWTNKAAKGTSASLVCKPQRGQAGVCTHSSSPTLCTTLAWWACAHHRVRACACTLRSPPPASVAACVHACPLLSAVTLRALSMHSTTAAAHTHVRTPTPCCAACMRDHCACHQHQWQRVCVRACTHCCRTCTHLHTLVAYVQACTRTPSPPPPIPTCLEHPSSHAPPRHHPPMPCLPTHRTPPQPTPAALAHAPAQEAGSGWRWWRSSSSSSSTSSSSSSNHPHDPLP